MVRNFELVTLTAFAAVRLILVIIGIFSVMAYAVSLPTHEVGVRMALGARQTNILRLALGVLLGLSAGYTLSRFLTGQISGFCATDPWTFGGVALLVVSVGIAACFFPARRAASVDPLVALRYE